MAKRGRPNKYYTHVQPRLKEIEEYATYMTEKQIADVMGVGYTSSWMEYKKKFPELREALKRGRRQLVKELRSALIKRAKGFDYVEIAETYEGEEMTKREIKTKHALPDIAALNLALKNYDPENWANDPQILEIRKKELKLREKQIEENNW